MSYPSARGRWPENCCHRCSESLEEQSGRELATGFAKAILERQTQVLPLKVTPASLHQISRSKQCWDAEAEEWAGQDVAQGDGGRAVEDQEE